MIDSLNINAGVVRPVERTLPSEVAKTSPKVEAVQQQDTAEMSAFSREHEMYMSVLRTLPEVRPDVVAKGREMLNPRTQYPPLDIVDGISTLIGKQVVRSA